MRILAPKERMVVALAILSLLAVFQHFSPQLLLNLVLVVVTVAAAEYFFWVIRGIDAFFPTAGFVSGLIIFLLAGPQVSPLLLFIAVAAAIATKQFLRPQKQHLLNPAGAGLIAASFLGLPITWWGISSRPVFLLVTIVLTGFVSLFTIRQHRIVFPFLLSVILISALYGHNPSTAINQLLVGSFWFFALVMLPEPMTAAHYPNTRIFYGIAVAALSFLLPISGLKTEPLVSALLTGNFIFWLVEKKLKIQK